MTDTGQSLDKDAPVSEDEVQALARHLLKRPLLPGEVAAWMMRVRNKKLDFKAVFDLIVATAEYRNRAAVSPGHPPGHYYSPVVNPAELTDRFPIDRRMLVDELPGLSIRDADLRAEFEALKPLIARHRFPDTKADGQRYYAQNGIYPLGDAIILAAMVSRFRPQQIVEIGSGFSTACMLDAIERDGLATTLTCIEPYPTRLRANLTGADHDRVTIVEDIVQTSDVNLYTRLEAGDILFIDSTHVAKTGSDVCFEIFEILPRLKPGVIVHVHDIHFPFEYPEAWIFDKRWSWNEIYLLRAFLMFNDRFPVIAFNNYFNIRHRKEMESAYGAPVGNPGGGIWMRVSG